MEVQKIKNQGKLPQKIILSNGDKKLIISFENNLDLYWTLSKSPKEKLILETFEITKEDYAIYTLFEQLYNRIKNASVFDIDTEIALFESGLSHFDSLADIYDFYKENVASLKESDAYHELFDGKTITWCSDEFNHDNANILKIRKIDDEFELEFIPKSKLSGFINGSSNIGRVTIKFCNSGSYYAPFNVMFMRLFNKLQLVDDVKDIKHQVSIDEYMYNKNKGKRLVKR